MTDHLLFVFTLISLLVFFLGGYAGFLFFTYSLRWVCREANCGQFQETIAKLMDYHITHKKNCTCYHHCTGHIDAEFEQ